MAIPKYLTVADINTIKYWTAGKVEYGIDPLTSITDDMLNNIVAQSEMQIETQLSYRYATYPSFTTTADGQFTTLPQQTQLYLIKLIQVYTVIFILEMDFGRNNGTLGQEYLDNMKREFVNQMKMQAERDPSGKFVRPALPDLKLSNAFNSDVTFDIPYPVGGENSITPYVGSQMDNPAWNWVYGGWF